MATIFPVPENMTSVGDVLPFATDVTGGALGILILILIGAATFIITSSFSPKQGFVATGFILAMASLFLWLLEMISTTVMWVMISSFLILLLASFFVNDRPA